MREGISPRGDRFAGSRRHSGVPRPLRWLLLLSLAEVATMLTFGSYSAALPVLRAEWHLTAAQAGGVFAGQQLGYTAAVLVLSSLTDIIGVRTIYLVSALWNGIFGMLFALLANGFTSALLLRTFGGIGLAGTYMPGMRLVVESFPAARRGGAMGIYIASFSLGTSLSLLLTGVILPMGWRTAFLATAGGPLLALMIAWPIVRDVPRQAPRRSVAVARVLRNARAMRFITAYAAHNWELFAMRAWLPAFLTTLWVRQGLTLTSATARGAAFASAVLLASGVSNAAGGWLSDHLGRRRTIAVFLTASGFCSAAIGWTAPLGMAAVLTLAIVYGLLVTADSSTLSTAVAESAEPDALGTTMAVQSSLGFLVTAISPPLFGAILDLSGGTWGWAFASLAAAALAGVVTVLRIRQTPSSPPGSLEPPVGVEQTA